MTVNVDAYGHAIAYTRGLDVLLKGLEETMPDAVELDLATSERLELVEELTSAAERLSALADKARATT